MDATLFDHHRCSAIIRTDDPAAGEPAMRAAVEAGFRILEFTLTTPNALELIEVFAADERLTVGAGTVLTKKDAKRAAERGARFLVSPVADEAVIERAADLGLPMVAGVATPMEALRAHRAGAAYQKLFPIPSNPAVWIRSCLGPMPFLRIVPTSGATPENAAELLEAGAHALGFVQPIFEPGAMARHDWGAIRANAERCLAAVHDAIGATA